MALSWTMDKIGPICRSVEDCMVVLRAIHGPDGKDLTAEFSAPLDWSPAMPLKSLKVGVLREDFGRITNEPRKKLYDEALESLKKAGASLEDTKLPEETLTARNLLGMLNAEAAAAFDDLTRSGGIEKLNGQSRNDWPNSFRSARLYPAVDFVQTARARTMLMRQFHEYFAKYDVLVSPTGSLSLTVTNLTGHPQMVTPCGFPGNESMGLLFTGHLYEEGKMARVAKAFQDATDWNKKMPPGFGV
jgi:Asp-tRNA(Asn)/Glu-tRNA(Gln) amidotransferase A subunit family amidase